MSTWESLPNVQCLSGLSSTDAHVWRLGEVTQEAVAHLCEPGAPKDLYIFNTGFCIFVPRNLSPPSSGRHLSSLHDCTQTSSVPTTSRGCP